MLVYFLQQIIKSLVREYMKQDCWFFISWEMAIITLDQSYESGLLFPILK